MYRSARSLRNSKLFLDRIRMAFLCMCLSIASGWAQRMEKTASATTVTVGDEITYTLSYTNTNSTPLIVPMATPTDWTTQSGSGLTVNGGTVQTTANQPGVSTYNYSHGQDGILEITLEPDDNSSFGIALRHTGGDVTNGVYVTFNVDPGTNTIAVQVFDGTTLLDSTTLVYPGTPLPVKISAAGDRLDIWAGDTTAPTPNWSVSGIPVRAGYTGFINGLPDGTDASGAHTVSTFRSDMDSVFDVQLIDPIPPELNFVSASDGGTVVSGVVRFPVLPGPVLAGEVITHTWVASVATCPGGVSIINEAFTNLRGASVDFISALVLVTCSDTTCTAIPEPPDTQDILLCNNGPVPVISDFVTATGTLTWYSDATTTDAIPEPAIDLSVPTLTTYYVSQTNAEGCESARSLITVTIDAIKSPRTQNITINSGQVLDVDVVNEFNLETNPYSWEATDNPEVQGETDVLSSSGTITDRLLNFSTSEQTVIYSVTEDLSARCGVITHTLTVTVRPEILPVVSLVVNNAVEGSFIEVTVTLDIPVPYPVEFVLGWEGITADDLDISMFSESIFIPAGERTVTFDRLAIDDTEVEPDETLSVFIETVLSGRIRNPDITAEGMILDNDGTARISIGDAIAFEGELLTVPINLTAPLTEELVIDINYLPQTADETDFDARRVRVRFAPGEQDTFFEIRTNEDTESEPDETFEILGTASLANGRELQVEPGLATIRNDDNLPDTEKIITIDNVEITEGTTVEVTITLSSPFATEQRLQLFGLGGTASAEDYRIPLAPVTIPAGQTQITFTIEALLDATEEPTETFTIQSVLTSATTDKINYVPGAVTIYDSANPPQVAQIQIGNTEVLEGEDLLFTLTLLEPLTTRMEIELQITEISVSGDDYEVPPTLIVSFPPGETQAELRIPTIDDSEREEDETLLLEILTVLEGEISNPDATGLGLIFDNDDIPEVPESPDFPLYFTPNADGFHDTWQVSETVRERIKIIRIYDRFGQLLAQISPLGTGWDGRYNGKSLPATDYWYIAEFFDEQAVRGHFSLKR